MRLALLFISIFVLSSCSSVKIYDDMWCADAGKFGAECFRTVSSEEVSLNKYEWDKLRLGQICTGSERPGEGYTHIKTALEKLCADSSFCTPEQRATIATIARKVDNAIQEGGGAEPFETGIPANSADTEKAVILELGLQGEE
jgi:hypothetical protein